MNKKITFIIVSLILICAGIIGYFALKSNSDNISNRSSTASTTIEKEIVLPTLKELKVEKGNDLSDIGKVQISTVVFQDVNQAILTDEQGKEIKVSLTLTNKDNQEFSLSSIEYTPKDLHIGDTFGLAELDSHYFAYSYE